MLRRIIPLVVLLTASTLASSAHAEGASSVILSAENADGIDLVDVTVSIDGKDGPTSLDGGALDIAPGEHTFVFKLADGNKAERKVTIREGERNKCVAVTIGARVAAPSAPAPPMWPNADAAQPIYARSRATRSAPFRTIGLVTVGAGVASLVSGAVFGLIASHEMESSCDASTKVCERGTVGDARAAATISTIGFVAGGVLTAGGLALILVAPKTHESARVSAVPSMALGGAGVSLQGAF